MLQQLLQEYFDENPQPDPRFQRDFKEWVKKYRPGCLSTITSWVASVSGTTWPDQKDVNLLCDLVKKKFQPQDWPTAFGHLILTLIPCYYDNGNQWNASDDPRNARDDPIRLPPENVGRFFGYVQIYLQTQIDAGNDEARKRQFKATLAALEKGPPAKGVGLVEKDYNIHGQMYQARAVAIPYYPFPPGAVPPLQPIFDPDGDCKESMETAALQECVARREDVGGFELIKTVLGGPVGFRVSEVLSDFSRVKTVLGRLFGRKTTTPTHSFSEERWAFLDKKLGFFNIMLCLMGVFFYLSFALGGGGWLYGLNFFLLPLPRDFFWWGFITACAFLVVGLLFSLLWSWMRSVLPLKQKQIETPGNFYFLVFVEETDETPYYGQLKRISFGLTFFCAFVGAVVPFLQRPPAWAIRLVELMKARRLVTCAGLRQITGEDLQQVEGVKQKLDAILQDNRVTDCVFPLLNCGDVLAAWRLKRARFKEKCFRAKETTKGIWVFCFETLERMISRLLTPYKWRHMALRGLIMILLVLAFTFGQTPPPTLFLEVQSKEGYPKQQYKTAGMTFIRDMQPEEQVTLNIGIFPQIWWPFELKVESDSKTLFEEGESHFFIERRVWSQTPAKVGFHMPRDQSKVLVAVIVQDLLKRRSPQTLQFVLGESASP